MVASAEETIYMSVTNYTCRSGFEPVNGIGVSECHADGVWSRPTLTCTSMYFVCFRTGHLIFWVWGVGGLGVGLGFYRKKEIVPKSFFMLQIVEKRVNIRTSSNCWKVFFC